MKKAFTLAEIMIVFVVIGVLAGILVPIAVQSSPDENVMKLKKANTTLAQVIRELVTSDKYYCNGDLGIMADCETLLLHKSNDKYTRLRPYFCNTFADVISAKKINCYSGERVFDGYRLANNTKITSLEGIPYKLNVTPETINATKKWFDAACKIRAKTMGQEIIAADGIVYYQLGTTSFGAVYEGTNPAKRAFSPPNQFPANYGDENGFDIAYKVLCVDIDGFDETVGSENCDDKKDICPFGYGIRADGKILTGKRADEWLEKSMQKGEKDN